MTSVKNTIFSLVVSLCVFHFSYSGQGYHYCRRLTESIRLPRTYETLSVDTFRDKVENRTLYGFYTGYPEGLLSLVLNKTEIEWAIINGSLVQFDIKGNDQNGTCVYEKNTAFFALDIFPFIVQERMIFGAPESGLYLSMFSSDPDSYVWILACLNYEAGERTCPTNAVFNFLYTQIRRPNNLNLEQVARDLRKSTCLSMDGLPGFYNFAFVQGESTCPDDGVL